MLSTALMASAGLMTGALAGPALRRLVEPALEPGETKLPYRDLAGPRFAVGVGGCSIAALVLVSVSADPALWPIWIPLATLGVFLVGIDAVTTWLPLSVTRWLWAATGVGVLIAVILAPRSERLGLALTTVLGALAVGAFFAAFWWFFGGLGFGDVRLAPVLGAATASVSIETAVAGLLAGTLIGAAHGIVRRVRRRAGPFPYGPALVVGSFVGLVISR